MIKCAIFDLDGTLVNTIDDLGLACDYLLKKDGIEPHWTEADYKQFVGNGAKLLVERAFDHKLSEEELNEKYEQFKVKYDEIKLDHTKPYDGIVDVLNTLKKKGIKLAVCTNKPQVAAVGMVETLFGKEMFDAIVGGLDDVPKKPDPTGARKILAKLDVKANECVFIGDSDVDIKTAKNLGAESIACAWGFRDYGFLFKCYPTLIIEEPKYITKLF